MRYYPISIDSQGKKVLVLGGGQIATRKVRSLLRGDFMIYVLAESFTDDLVDLVKKYPDRLRLKGQYLRKDFIFMGYDLLVIATNSPDLNQAMEDYAKTKRILYVRCDKKSDSSFLMNKIMEKGPLVASLSSGGLSPTLTRLVGQDLEGVLEDLDLEKLDLLVQIREKLLDWDDQERSKVIKDLYGQDRESVKRYLEEINEDKIGNSEEQPSSSTDPASGSDDSRSLS